MPKHRAPRIYRNHIQEKRITKPRADKRRKRRQKVNTRDIKLDQKNRRKQRRMMTQ